MGVAHPLPPNLENLPFRRAKTAVQCTSAGQPTGPRTIGELLLLKEKENATDKNVHRATSHTSPPQNLVKLRPCE